MKPKRIVYIGADYPELEKFCPHHVGVQTGLKRLGIPFQFISCRPSLDVEKVISYKPDLLIYGLKDMIVRSDWRKELRARLPDTTIVIWYGDLRNEQTTQIDANCSEVQAMFISNDAQEEFYKRKWKVPEVHYLPLGCEPIAKPIKQKKFSFPFIFIGGQITGGAFHHRISVINNIKKRSDLKIINSFEPDMRKRIFQAMPSLYSSAKISLDVSHFTDIQGYTSIRFWEIPAFHGFALTKWWPGCEEYYPKEVRAYFNTTDEAIEKMEYYTTHEAEREKMLKMAHEISYQHTYDKRFLTMFVKL